MTVQAIANRIEEIEAEVALLKGELSKLQTEEPVKTFADLYGILKGKGNFSMEEIEAAHYKLDPDKYTEKYG